MSDGIYSALSGAIAQQRALDVVANNVANANTLGFRGDRVSFRELVAEANTNPDAPDVLRYVGVDKIAIDGSGGSLRQTGNTYDVALSGDGFFAVQTPRGERYTRAGSFITDGAGTLRSPDGHPVIEASGGEIQIPTNAREIVIARDGAITADGRTVARLKIVAFEPNAPLQKEGGNLLAAGPEAQPIPAADAQVIQGYVETANVNAVAGMNELITVSRSFEVFQRLIQNFRQLDERAAREIASR